MAERYPLSLNAVNVVCFKIDWDERALKVLLIKRNITPQKNKWSLPGGFVNIDETVEDAALRKFVEETGINSNKRCGNYPHFIFANISYVSFAIRVCSYL